MAEPGRALAVLTVTHDSAPDLAGWAAAVAGLGPDEVVVVDCASRDGSVAEAHRVSEEFGLPARVVGLEENLGFAGGMNRAFAESAAPYLLLLNPDARPHPGFADKLIVAMEADPRAGAATGRLVRPAGEGGEARLDACGMRLTWTWRHLDRGSGEPDRGQYRQPERVFGGTGAALLLSRRAAEDVAIEPGLVFDPLFHSFREDAELAFRLAERGWEVLFVPAAEAEHRRFSLPERRRALPAMVNYHSLKNRYLLRCYHQSLANLLLTLPATLARDLGALLYVLAFERSSLAAYGWLLSHRREILERSRCIRRRRKVSLRAVERWFFTAGLPR
ncbi:MAG TPA: glycosyltransferase [Thermoanaerobaculia bacterium]|nr:glycosyltransferase [Thermoanaerobaculia bacterium]